MSILITGGAGYIGSHTTVELLNASFDVVLVDDFSNSSPAVLERLEKITGKKFPFYQGSILDTDFLDKVFTNEDIELVIHFAAFKAVGESVQKPLKYYKNNISGTITLLEKMKEYDVKNIVCLQPFGCLPNHIVGKGMVKELRRQYKGANIAPIDYDPGSSEVNQLNRIRLIMTTAKKMQKTKVNA